MLPIQSPIGTLTIYAEDGKISAITFGDTSTPQGGELSEENQKIISECKTQLDEYFLGERKTFQIPCQQKGTPFQQEVWNELLHIPYGKTLSYLDLSKRLNNIKAIRAIGATNGKNAIPIIVPCHRVIGSNGSLTGYAGGLPAKQWLLEHENKFANGVHLLF